jgi:hypothetical protein
MIWSSGSREEGFNGEKNLPFECKGHSNQIKLLIGDDA